MSSQVLKINEDVRSFVERANVGQRGLRTVPIGVALEVARRSLANTEGESFSVRRFRALSDVSDFVSLTQKNKLTTLSALNTDLLPVAHPASTRVHSIPEVDVRRARARWFADDSRVTDSSVYPLLATAFTSPDDSPEFEYSIARLTAMGGRVPSAALVAAFNDGANKGYWRKQLRGRDGRWMEMGGGLRSLVRRSGDGPGQASYMGGNIVSTDADRGFAVMQRVGDKQLIRVPASASESVRAFLPGEETADGFSPNPVSVSAGDEVLDESSLTFVDAPDGFEGSSVSEIAAGSDGAESWVDELENYEVTKFSDDDFVVSRFEEDGPQPFARVGDWLEATQAIKDDEPRYEKGDAPKVSEEMKQKLSADLPSGAPIPGRYFNDRELAELKQRVSGDEIQSIKEQSILDYVSEQERFPVARQTKYSPGNWGETSDVAQGAKRDYQKVYDLLKERDPEFAEKYPDMESFWDKVKEYSLDERTRAYDTTDPAKVGQDARTNTLLPEEVKQFNRAYAEAVLGMDPDGEITLYRNVINDPANIKQAGTGYWSTDREFAKDYAATPDNIAKSKEEGRLEGFYEARVRPDQVGGMLGYSEMEDEFSLSIGPDVASEEGRITRLGPIEPPELPEWLDPDNYLDLEKRTGGSAFRHHALAGSLDLKKVDNNPMGDGNLDDFLKENGISKEEWAARYDALWGEGSYAEAKASGNNPSFQNLQSSFVQDDDGKWFLDVEDIDYGYGASRREKPRGSRLNPPYYGDGDPETFKNDRFDAKMKMLGLVQDITGEEFMSVKRTEPREMPERLRDEEGPVSDIEEPSAPEGVDELPEGGEIEEPEEAPEPPPAAPAPPPDGPGPNDDLYRVDRGPYEPKGPSADVESDEYTDDPADLAVRFTPEELGDALKDAVNDGSGLSRLEFEDDKGTEDVPAEAVFNALKLQGVDAEDFLDRVEAGEDVRAQLPEGAGIPELDDVGPRRFEDAVALREIMGDRLPDLLSGLSDRELQSLIDNDYDFTSLISDNKDFNVPDGFYELDYRDYDPLEPLQGVPGDLRPFDLALEFTPEQLENQLREALTPGAERPGYGKFELPDGDGESQSFDVRAEAIVDALKLHAIDTDSLIDEVYDGGEPSSEQVDDAIDGEGIETPEVFGLDQETKDELIESTKQGGYTVDFVSGDVPEDGYMVASEADIPGEDGNLRKREEVVSRADFDEDPEKYLDEFVARNLDRLTEDKYYIGTWTSTVKDKETGEETEYVYFDVSERIEDKEEALQAARDRDEIAIFGLAEFEEFFTDPEREARKNAGRQTEEGDGPGAGELPGDDREGTPRVDDEDGPGDSEEPEGQEEYTPDELALGYIADSVGDNEYLMPGDIAGPAIIISQQPNGKWIVTSFDRSPSGEDTRESDIGTYDSAEEAFEVANSNRTGGPVEFSELDATREREEEDAPEDSGEPEEQEEYTPDELAIGYMAEKLEDDEYIMPGEGDDPAMIISRLRSGRWVVTAFNRSPSGEDTSESEVGTFDSADEAFDAANVNRSGGPVDFSELDAIREREEAPESETGADRPFGEEIVELDVDGDVESQVSDAIDNQRELEFAYPDSDGELKARLVRPVRVEENERTGNVNVLAVDDEGNSEKFTLSKVQPVSDAEVSRDEVSDEDSPGDEVETDDATLPESSVENFVDAEDKVFDDIYESDDVDNTNDVEDLGEQEDTADNVTSEIVNRVDESAAGGDEGPEQRVVDDVVEGAILDGDGAVPSLDDLISDARNEDNFDPDIIWQKVQDDYDGKVLENGHIVVSSTVHSTRRGDRRYDVVVRRASDNTFHIYHRVTYPDGSTKVKEMGGQGWHSAKALFSRIDDQIDNSVNSPNSTINKALKPENDLTLFADNPAPRQPDSFVASDGTVLQRNDRVTVVNPNHSKAGMGGRVVKAQRRYNSKDFTYTDYVKVKFDDGTKNWIVSKSVKKEAGSAPDADIESALNEKQSGGVPDNLLAGPDFDNNVENLFGSADASGARNVVDGLEETLNFLPTPENSAAGDANLPDVRVQRIAGLIKAQLGGLREGIATALRGLEQTESFDGDAPGNINARAKFANQIDNIGSALVSNGSNLENAAREEGGPRESFYRSLGRRLINAGDALQGAAEDARLGLRNAYDSAGAETIGDSLPDANDLTIENVEGFIDDIVGRLPEPNRFALVSVDDSNDPFPPEHKEASHDLGVNFKNAIRAVDGNLALLSTSSLDSAIEKLSATEGRHDGVRQDLEKLKEEINLYKARQPTAPYAAPGLEAFDPLEVRDSRIAAGENVFAPGENNEIRNFVLSDARDAKSPLNAFEDELEDFFDGSPRPLAELSPRARVALQISVGQNLKTNLTMTPELEESMIELTRGLEVEEQAYYPQRESLSSEVDVLKGLPRGYFDGLLVGQEVGQDDALDDSDKVKTGWIVQRQGSGNTSTYQLKHEDTGEIIWVKNETTIMAETDDLRRIFAAEYVANEMSRAMGGSGIPLVEFSNEDRRVMFMSQAGETEPLEDSLSHFSFRTSEYAAVKETALMDVVRLSILDFAMKQNDRHGGNFLIGNLNQRGVSNPDSYDLKRLIPIDNGYSGAFVEAFTETDDRTYLEERGSQGGGIIRELIRTVGSDRFQSIAFPMVENLISDMRNLRDAGPPDFGAYSGSSRAAWEEAYVEGIDEVITNLNTYLQSGAVFDDIARRGQS